MDAICLALDGTTAYAAYSDGVFPATLRLATRKGNTWSVEDIDQDALETSAAIDADGVLHLVYHTVQYPGERLVHAWRAPTGWQYESLLTQHEFFGQPLKQSLFVTGNWPAMTRDFAGRLSLAFGLFVGNGQASGSALTVAVLHDGVWVPRKIGPGLTGYGTAIAADRSGIVHVATGKPIHGGQVGTVAVQLKGRKLALRVDPPQAGTITDELTGLQCNDKLVEQIYPGTELTLSVTAARGFTFVEWARDASGSDSSCQVTMDQARRVEARFEPSP
jgi:hypothetical protein